MSKTNRGGGVGNTRDIRILEMLEYPDTRGNFPNTILLFLYNFPKLLNIFTKFPSKDFSKKTHISISGIIKFLKRKLFY